MPGHTNAALASYPELNCDGVAPELYTGIEVGFSSLCIEKEITYQFVDDVCREIAALTPGNYIHIGGDEAQSTSQEDFKRFIQRVEGIVKSHGKNAACWEEAVQSDLSPEAVLQYWTDVRYVEMAVAKGIRLIISPAPRTYLDMKYAENTPLGLDWAGKVSVQQAYDWDPVKEVKGLEESAIMGVEAPLWSETLRTMKDIEYMTFPRLPGIAEIGWSLPVGRSWAEYRQRLAAHGPRWTAKGVNFYRSPEIPWE
jgi:hexosaminidase